MKELPAILFVDDEPMVVDILSRLFEKEYRVHTAHSGAEAMAILRSEAIDLLVTDQRMPRQTGIELAFQAREEGFSPTVILLTGYTEPREIIDAINRGQVYRYVTKPWDMTELRMTLRNALEHHFLTSERARLVAALRREVDGLEIVHDVSQSEAASGPYAALVLEVVERFRRTVRYELGTLLILPVGRLSPGVEASLYLLGDPEREPAGTVDRVLTSWRERCGEAIDAPRVERRPFGGAGKTVETHPIDLAHPLEALLIIDERPVGLIQLFAATPWDDPEEEQGLLERLANRTAGIVANLKESFERDHRRRENFISSVSHEVRTPMTAISGALEVVMNALPDSFPAKQRRFLAMAKESADSLNGTIDSLLDVTRFARGKMRMHPRGVRVESLVEEAISRHEPLALSRGLQFEFLPSEPPLPEAHLDRERFAQVLNNLFTNALKFAPEGGTLRVELGSGPLLGGARSFVLSVLNDGEPIPESERERIFEPFEQGASASRSSRGTGLGLAICRNIVEAHGGTIHAEPGRTRGARFQVTLPLATPRAAPREE